MKRFSNIAAVVLTLVVAPMANAAPGLFSSQNESVEKPVLLAQAGKKKPAKGGKAVREKFITREATLKSKDQKNLDFEAANIGGARKAPLGSLIGKSNADKNYDFVKIRLRWHPEMVQSASSLDYSN
jgi:hypothetical protein